MPSNLVAPNGALVVVDVGSRDVGVAAVVQKKDVFEVTALAYGGGSDFDTPETALDAALEGRGLKAHGAMFVLGEVTTRARLMTTPDAKGRLLDDFISNEIAPDDVFVETLVGRSIENGRELPTRLVVSATKADATAMVRAAEDRGVSVSRTVALDALLLAFARRRAGDTSERTRIVALVEPGWTHFVCVADGRSIYVRRVETDPEAPAAGRLDEIAAEAQKTALVVRGRLKPPQISGCLVLDPAGVLDPSEAAAVAESSGFQMEIGSFPVTIVGASSPAARGHAVRAALAAAVRAEGNAIEACALAIPTVGGRGARRGLASAAVAACLVVWGAGWWGREFLMDEAETLRKATTRSESIDPLVVESLIASNASMNAVVNEFDESHEAVFQFHGSPPPVSETLEALAAATPFDAVLTSVASQLTLDAGGTPLRETRVEGIVRRPFVESREVVKSFTAALRARPETISASEEPAAVPTTGKEASLAATPFAFVLRTGARP